LIGDVTGNYNPASHARPGIAVRGQMLDVGEDGGGPERGVSVELPNLSTPLDKEIIIPVSVQGAADKEIISYEFDLRYDPTVIQPSENPVDVRGTASRGLIAVANPNEPGLLRVVLYGPLPIDENGLLLKLRFKTIGASGSTSPLIWDRIIFNDGTPGITVANGLIELSDAVGRP
jgi:Cohesin domain